jgi:hypothetical protein
MKKPEGERSPRGRGAVQSVECDDIAHAKGRYMELSKIAREVISLSEEIQAYWDTELPKRHRDYPIVRPGEDSGPPPPAEKRLRDLLASLPNDAIYTLALVMYVGRGDFGTDDLAAHYKELKKMIGRSTLAVSRQMIEKASLADHLRDGLAELKKSGIDVDHLTETSVLSGR